MNMDARVRERAPLPHRQESRARHDLLEIPGRRQCHDRRRRTRGCGHRERHRRRPRQGTRRQLRPVRMAAPGARRLTRFPHDHLLLPPARGERIRGRVLLHRQARRGDDLLGSGEGRHDSQLQLRALRVARDEPKRQRRRLAPRRKPQVERHSAGRVGDEERVRRPDPPRHRRLLHQTAAGSTTVRAATSSSAPRTPRPAARHRTPSAMSPWARRGRTPSPSRAATPST